VATKKCGALVLWRNVGGSQFRLSARGDSNQFHIVCTRNVNGATAPAWQHNQLVPGPAAETINSGDICTFLPQITLFSDQTTPVVVNAGIYDSNGKLLDGCSWSFGSAVGSPYILTINVTG
jgi:hypothetical protein